MDIHIQIQIIFHSTPLGCLSRICFVKTLLKRNWLGKNLSERNRVQYPHSENCLVKNLIKENTVGQKS